MALVSKVMGTLIGLQVVIRMVTLFITLATESHDPISIVAMTNTISALKRWGRFFYQYNKEP